MLYVNDLMVEAALLKAAILKILSEMFGHDLLREAARCFCQLIGTLQL